MKIFYLKNRLTKASLMVVVMMFFYQIILPSKVIALTSGPSTPEVRAPAVIGVTDIVNPFTGDFSYSIPLMDVGGFPLTVVYDANISMDQEASEVGLGWSLNTGAITRTMRGLPDEFNGDEIIKKRNSKPKKTLSGTIITPNIETWGINYTPFSIGAKISYNNYEGLNLSALSSLRLRTPTPVISLGFSSEFESGTSGLSLNPALSLSIGEGLSISGRAGVDYQSREGLKSLTLGVGASIATNVRLKIFGLNASTTIPFGTQTYVPNIQWPTITNTTHFTFKGGTFFSLGGTSTFVSAIGQESKEELTTKERRLPAYGYLYSNNELNALQDFNREDDGPILETTPTLPIPNYTYDIFIVKSPTSTGIYRAYRSDIGILADPVIESHTRGKGIGAEAAGGNFFHGGFDYSLTRGLSRSGKWNDDNELLNRLTFKDKSRVTDEGYEPYYFKQIGEHSNRGFYKRVGASSVDRLGIGSDQVAKPLKDANWPTASDNNILSERQKRNQVFTFLNRKEAVNFGLEQHLYFGNDSNDIYNNAPDHHIAEITILGANGNRSIFGLPAYNIKQFESSFNVSPTPDNELKKYDGHDDQVTFNDQDNSLSNNRGLDHLYTSTEIPAYPYAWLQTAYLSADYVDVDNNGPSDADHGNWIKFYRSKQLYNWRTPLGNHRADINRNLRTSLKDDYGSFVYGEKEVWYLERIETRTTVAVFEHSNRHDGYGVIDESGSIGGTRTPLKKLDKITLYAKKGWNIWQNGGQAAQPIKSIYFEYDYSLCPGVPNNLRGGGKLTLKKVWFTYGKDQRGVLTPYEFTYNSFNPAYALKSVDRWGMYKAQPPSVFDATKSPFKDNTNGAIDNLTNAEYPFVQQNKSEADQNAQAWTLKRIKLPSGGEIVVDLEADDYAYVQDKKAMQMFKVVYLVNNINSFTLPSNSEAFRVENLMNGEINNLYCIFELQDPIAVSGNAFSDWAAFRADYFNSSDGLLNTIYYNFLVNIKKESEGSHYEYVSGWAELAYPSSEVNMGQETYGLVDPQHNPSGNAQQYEYGWVRLKSVSVNEGTLGTAVNTFLDAGGTLLPDGTLSDAGTTDNDLRAVIEGTSLENNLNATLFGRAHPISRMAVQFARMHRSNLLYDIPYDVHQIQNEGELRDITSNNDLEEVFKTIWSFTKSQFTNIKEALIGPTRLALDRDYCKVAMMNKSWIRLMNPTQKKFGGGSRIKQLTIKDNWNTMEPGEAVDCSYGIAYDYTLDGRKSSGVAANEPQIGMEENALVQPIPYQKKNKAILDQIFYKTTPFGKSFYPGPSIGYSKVTTQSVTCDDVVDNGVGTTVYEFYTAKDFPIQSEKSTMGYDRDRPGWLVDGSALGVENPFKSVRYDRVVFSQGYVIETNDMHGKPKSVKAFQRPNANGEAVLISGTKYSYKTDPNKARQLVNLVDVVQPNGAVSQQELGVELDVAIDMREAYSKSKFKGGAQINGFIIAVPWWPFVWPTGNLIPQFPQQDEIRTRVAVIAKVISRLGILDEIRIFDRGSEASVKTENMMYDSETGAVILTSATNDFNDEIYGFTYPAHWVYEKGMGQAYKNIGVDFDDIAFVNGAASITNADRYFVPGDELIHTDFINITITKKTFNDFSPYVIVANYDNGARVQNYGPVTLRNLETGNVYTDITFDSSGGAIISAGDYATINVGDVLTTAESRLWVLTVGNHSITVIERDGSLVNRGPIDIKVVRSGRRNMASVPIGTLSSRKNPLSSGQFLPDVTDEIISVGAVEYIDRWGFYCGHDSYCGLMPGDIINPFVFNMRGTWRPLKGYTFLGKRDQVYTLTGGTDIRTDGEYSSFSPFWTYSNRAKLWEKNPLLASNWKWGSEVTLVDSFGSELENKDVLGRYSSAVFGFNHTLATGIAANAKYNEIAEESFEDNGYPLDGMCRNHFEFSGGNIVSTAHSGKKGYVVPELTSAEAISLLRNDFRCSVSRMTDPVPFTIDHCDCLSEFNPLNGVAATDSGKRYVASVWINTSLASDLDPYANYNNIDMQLTAGAQNITTSPIRSDVIDGWQQLTYVITIPASETGEFRVLLRNNNPVGSGINANFDDFRIHPFNSSMITYAYNPLNLRPMATLDERNYATFYEYDASGSLIRTKKETERGVVTLSENRGHVKGSN